MPILSICSLLAPAAPATAKTKTALAWNEAQLPPVQYPAWKSLSLPSRAAVPLPVIGIILVSWLGVLKLI